MAGATDTARATLPPGRVLIADEAPTTRRLLAAVMRDFDPRMEVLEAADGRQALDLLTGKRPEIAFVNIQLSGMTGPEALAYAKAAHDVRPFTVLMSNAVLPKWVDVSVELDAYEFLKKPFDIDHIANLLAVHRRMRQPSSLLLVDDSPTARGLVKRVLSQSRFTFEIEEIESGPHALKLLRLTPFELALIDFNLGGMDGLEVVCQGRELAPDTKFLLMSGSDSTALPQASRVFGLVGFLKKPFYGRDVDVVMHEAYGLRRPYLLNALIGPPVAARPAAHAR
ncbi:MAG TPA: response regulator [Beijerinckiaceae bacterium]|jgi:CheY-like chemotaxis protein